MDMWGSGVGNGAVNDRLMELEWKPDLRLCRNCVSKCLVQCLAAVY